ncbi:MAG: hypothetical protein Q7S89_01590 [bacterium]|nr:hypothetical protein [bacterium]
MKKVLLVGCGAEIGATLIAMNRPEQDGFAITAILTNPIAEDHYHPHLSALDSLYARIVLEQPHMLDAVSVDRSLGTLVVRGRPIMVHWGDSTTFDLKQLKDQFDVCIFATSKKQISERAIIGRFVDVARFVVGVAEAKGFPTIYANLIGAPSRFFSHPPREIGAERIFCLGSCQSNGWQAQLRAVLELVERLGCTFLDMHGMEVDIVHPDTPTGRLGTKSVEARSQDPRNNLRPSFSQIEMAMNILFPNSHNVNTVALRVLTMPPGYQISRFFFRYERAQGQRFTRDEIVESFTQTARALPATLRMAPIPLGSRGFEQSEASAIVLEGERYLKFFDNPFRMTAEGRNVLSELIVQAYVHNVRGYCRSVLDVVRYVGYDPHPQCFLPETIV